MYKLSSFNVFQIVVNTNGNEHLTENALSLVSDALGPFRYEIHTLTYRVTILDGKNLL